MTTFSYFSAPVTWIAFVFGMLVGSFLNVCIVRIPQNEFWRYARSVCPRCRQMISWYDNIPIFSYLWLRARARCCGSTISKQYPLVELGTGVFFVLCYWYAPFILRYSNGFAIDHTELLRFLHLSLFGSLLIVCSIIDLHHMIIPDVISIPMILVSPLVALIHPDLSLQSSLIGVLLGGGLLYAVAWIYWIARREVGLGFGDVKLLAAIGGWLGYEAIIPTILIGSIVGSLTGIVLVLSSRSVNFKSALPFGPFLALGAFVHMFVSTRAEEAIARLFGN